MVYWEPPCNLANQFILAITVVTKLFKILFFKEYADFFQK